MKEEEWQVAEAGEEWRTVLQSDGRPATMFPGWSAQSALVLQDGGCLLLLVHEGGPKAAWVLDDERRYVGDLHQLSPEVSPETHRSVRAAATRFVLDVRRDPLRATSNAAWAAVRQSGEATLFAHFAETDAKVIPVRHAVSIQVKVRAGGSCAISLDAARTLLALSGPVADPKQHPWLEPAARAGRIELPALSQAGSVDAVFMVGRWDGYPTYLCIERTQGLHYYLIQRPEFPTVLYFPDDDLIVRQEPLEASEAMTYAILSRLDLHLMELVGHTVGAVPERTAGLGLFVLGILNFGHAIWDEMHAVDTMLSMIAPTASPPRLYMVPGASGLDLYGPVEELYPELAGNVTRGPSEVAVYAAAIEAGVGLVLRTGQGALHRTRDRIDRVVRHHADEHDLAAQARELLGPPGRERLVVTLGLRLSNRCPVDLAGFYARLTRELRRRFGPLVIVIDGINGGDDPGKPAAFVFNGLKKWELDFIQSFRDGSAELRAEMDWVDEFTRLVQAEDITVVSCVGRPIRENLFWMSKSNFFVAPFGGGVAKLRWALDIPGFVLVSRTNLEYCVLLHVYDDEQHMDGPFTPLYFNGVEDVTDVPTDPPRTEPPMLHGIPQPEDFIVGEAAVIPRICDLVAKHAPRHRAAGDRSFKPWTRLKRVFGPTASSSSA